ncbi:MAG: patatin-like phospholipase family protein [Deltaproteobacteria bacterium]|nr:patatin-like phospholipase family protein [Deltaproteobacteria bacterium]
MDRLQSLCALTLAALLAACSPTLVNGKLETFDQDAGYRYGKLSGDGNSDDLFVILAFSGGGTRAAAFSFGVMEGLRDAVYNASGAPRRFLDDIDVISSVSGGSFTAAYYALFPEKFFTKFPSVFLERNVQGDLIRLALWPPNWLRLASSGFDRINLAAEYYNQNVFENKTFAELIEKPRKPYIILNATDMTLGRRFEFTQDQFDLLCSDLSTVKVATAVAASSAFPGLLSPLTVKNFAAEGCKYERPQWLTDALDRNNAVRRYAHARDLWSYQDPKLTRDYIHLLDGGLGDNIGLRGPYVAMSSNDSSWSLYQKINRREVRRVVVISANAKTNTSKDWDQQQAAPGILDVLSLVTGGPMDNYSFETVQLVRDMFDRLKDEERAWNDCKQLLHEQCSGKMPGVLRPVDFYASELSFDSLDDENLRHCMENLPTTFSLPEDTVTLVRQVARLLLMKSADFGNAMKALDPSWQPSEVQIDPAILAKVCSS